VVRAALQPGVGVALPLRTIAVHMAQRLADGVREFRIRLDPPELGRIDIRMEITRDGHLSAHLITDRPEALDALQRDARALERALQAAGLDLEEGDLSFNLRGNGARGEGEQADRSDGTPGEAGETGAEPEAAIGRTMRLGALDITV
jgi:flagellar hook-length control protein FliK